MWKELTKTIDEIIKEKKISKEAINEILREAIQVAVISKIGKYYEPRINIDVARGILEIFISKEVVGDDEYTENNLWLEIPMSKAQEIEAGVELGSVIEVPAGLEILGRKSIITARQRILERIRDNEKKVIFEDFGEKKGEIISGTVLKVEPNGIVVTVGKSEAYLPKKEMIPADNFNRGDRIRALLLDIRTTQGWPQPILSRTHPLFLQKLFESEIPEVFEGIIQVKKVARIPGERAKVAVYSDNRDIDPVGTCIGIKSARRNSISDELCGEKLDIFLWSDNQIELLCNSISPAEVIVASVIEDERTLEIVVPDSQLSLAIGKHGQNVRLTAMITDWRLDVLKESEYENIRQERLDNVDSASVSDISDIYELSNLSKLVPEQITKLVEAGIADIEVLSTVDVSEIMEALSIDEDAGYDLVDEALAYLSKQAELHEDFTSGSQADDKGHKNHDKDEDSEDEDDSAGNA